MIRSLAALAMLAMLTGCALTEDVVDVKYIPTTASIVPDAKPVALTVTDGRSTDRTRISAKMNGYGMEMAAIRSQREVPDIVKTALTTEFEKRGFHTDASGRAVSVTINSFYNQFGTGFFNGHSNGDVSLTVSVAGAGAPYNQTYAGVSKADIMTAGGTNAAESVAAALSDAVTKMFADPAFVSAITSGKAASKPVS